MSQYDNNMTGIISRNDSKEQPNHPDYKGNCEVDGVQYWLSGWIKQRKDGQGSFLSLSFKPKDQQTGNRGSSASKQSYDEPPDDLGF